MWWRWQRFWVNFIGGQQCWYRLLSTSWKRKAESTEMLRSGLSSPDLTTLARANLKQQITAIYVFITENLKVTLRVKLAEIALVSCRAIGEAIWSRHFKVDTSILTKFCNLMCPYFTINSCIRSLGRLYSLVQIQILQFHFFSLVL